MYKKRLNKIKGQINGIEKMLESDRACMDVIQQIAAVRSAVSKLGIQILREEAKTCTQEGQQDKLEKVVEKLFKLT
jgi:DNA-binding FrmR family transcriptional regulator